jgi:SNF2 family DNA or RNA helicase
MPLSLALVKESLELAGIPCLEFTSRNKTKVRTDNVMTFETSSTYRVFLMELKHGARGL